MIKLFEDQANCINRQYFDKYESLFTGIKASSKINNKQLQFGAPSYNL